MWEWVNPLPCDKVEDLSKQKHLKIQNHIWLKLLKLPLRDINMVGKGENIGLMITQTDFDC